MSKVHLVGTKRDRKDHLKLQRSDDDKRQFLVSTARKAIYEGKNYGITSAYVERLLQAESLVPTTVILFPFFHALQCSAWRRSECIFRLTLKAWARCVFPVSGGPNA